MLPFILRLLYRVNFEFLVVKKIVGKCKESELSLKNFLSFVTFNWNDDLD
jgi:hypothetical protein